MCIRDSGNTATTSRIVTWATAPNPPSFTGTYSDVILPGCNPSATDISAALGSATVTSACGTPVITSSDGPVTGTCTQSRTRTFIANDGCGNTATVSRTCLLYTSPSPRDS